MSELKFQSASVDAHMDTSIGTLLLESGALTESDVKQILRFAKNEHILFGEAAIKLGLANKADIQHALARQFDYPYLKAGEGDFGKELVAAYKPFTQKVESFRALRMQLMLRWFAAGHSTLAVVSATPQEGRTFLAANLAIVFSQLGSRTLLIDANLQNARLHKVFKIKNSPGLAPALVSRSDAQTGIQKIPHFENLWVLPAGAPPPNPEELLARNEFEDILQECSHQYDIILIDTPPGQSGTGAETVAYRCGGALLTVRRNWTTLAEAKEFTNRLQGRAELVGSVLTTF